MHAAYASGSAHDPPAADRRSTAAWSTAAEELLVALMHAEPGARVVRLAPGTLAPRGAQRVFALNAADTVLAESGVARAGAGARQRVDATTGPGAATSMLGSEMWRTLLGSGPLRERLAVVGGSGSLSDHLSELVGEPVTYAMRIDEIRTSRCPSLQLFDARGRVVAHASLGVSPASRLELQAHADALETVGAREWTHFEVPRVLGRTEWQGNDVLVRSALVPSLWQGRSRRRAEAPLEAMGELSTAWSGGSHTLDEMPWMQRQVDVAGSLRSRTARRRFGAAIDQVLADARRTTWPTGAWHGDWTAHSMARHGSRLQVWNWTRFETDVPVGLDPCHFAVQAITDRDGFTRTTVRDGLRTSLQRTHGPAASVLGALYLVAVASRELVLAEGPGGHRVEDHAEVLLGALEDWLTARR